MTDYIHLHGMMEQGDGRFLIIYSKDGKEYRQGNAAFCCVGRVEDTDGDRYVTVTFEVVGVGNNITEGK